MRGAVKTTEFNMFVQELFSRLDELENQLKELKGEQDEIEYFTITQVAKRLNFSTTKIRHMYHDGTLEGAQLADGKNIRIKKTSVEAYERGDCELQLPTLKFA